MAGYAWCSLKTPPYPGCAGTKRQGRRAGRRRGGMALPRAAHEEDRPQARKRADHSRGEGEGTRRHRSRNGPAVPEGGRTPLRVGSSETEQTDGIGPAGEPATPPGRSGPGLVVTVLSLHVVQTANRATWRRPCLMARYHIDLSGSVGYARTATWRTRAVRPLGPCPSGPTWRSWDRPGTLRLHRKTTVKEHMAKKENGTLTKTRNILLPKLMSGDIRLAATEKAAEIVG